MAAYETIGLYSPLGVSGTITATAGISRGISCCTELANDYWHNKRWRAMCTSEAFVAYPPYIIHGFATRTYEYSGYRTEVGPQ